MKAFSVIFSLVALFMSASCAIQSNKVSSPEENVNLEAVYGFNINDRAVSFTVISNGCTNDSDFQLSSKMSGQTVELSLIRKKPDYCRKMPSLTEVSFPVDETWSPKHVRVLNPNKDPKSFSKGISRKPK